MNSEIQRRKRNDRTIPPDPLYPLYLTPHREEDLILNATHRGFGAHENSIVDKRNLTTLSEGYQNILV